MRSATGNLYRADQPDVTRRRPDWWSYPLACPNGHTWAPGLVIVSWSPCDCAAVTTVTNGEPPQFGHLIVSCQAPGCMKRWFKPRHDAVTATSFTYPSPTSP
jgi:hypothetical protein